ncbi:hypothetical protein BIZ37_19365 [Photobacterium sp. BZF1]|uniref:hypothetical protein n=1 Tax=Photobacterium sp. BZF1 TaxID=1904457 RepID=UPI0016539B1B|nr:hypothetical protein [Photobacterium sp. BZF1]MBC7004725.1 hypothetical protein [Photobacterium sp. BZF1]
MESTKLKKRNEDNTQPDSIKGKGSSRFSRRRFLQTTTIATPLLLSVKSPAAWGGGGNLKNCSITEMLSGNASHPHSCQVDAKSPRYWRKVFKSQDGEDLYVVQDVLNQRGVFSDSQFNLNFLSTLSSPQSIVGSDWEYQLSSTLPDNPTYLNALKNNTSYSIILTFDNGVDQPFDIDLTKEGVDDFHQVVVAGYLNSLFHPSIITYVLSPEQVKQSVIMAILESAKIIINSVENGEDPAASNFFDYSTSPMLNLRNFLHTW